MGPLSVREEVIEFTERDGTKLSAQVLRPDNNEVYPGIVVVHGGSWGGRSFEDMSALSRYLASHGFVVFNTSYRFAPEHRYPKQIEDLDTGIEWFKANAEKYRWNKEKLAGWGYSAGGHLITQWAQLKGESTKKPALTALVAGGAPFDLSWYPFSPIITHLLDGFRDERLKEYKEASPINHLGVWSPPMYLYHGEQDRLVEAVQSSHMQNRLRDHGVEVELHLVKFWGHVNTFLFDRAAVENGMNFLRKRLQ